ncbi:MAG: FAD-dependent oxidoreductase [Micrococcus sp.]|nr:FAD-dependent oxidoreductase [Micrococcus sp.]
MPKSRSTFQPSILMVGAGVLGVNLASELARHGHRVTILDAGEAGTGTTAGSYAWVNSNSKSPASYADLNLYGLRAHERWSAARTRTWFHQTGNLQVVHGAERMADVEREAAQYLDAGYPAQLLTARGVAELEPGLNREDVVGGVLFPLEGWADTAAMTAVLLQEAQDHGAQYLPYHRVIELTESGVSAQTPDGGTSAWEADVTVLTAGNGIRALTRGLGLEFPTRPTALDEPLSRPDAGHHTVGMTVTTSAATGLPGHMVQTDDVSFRPSPTGGVMITDHPTASRWDPSGETMWAAPDDLLRRARRICPALDSTEVVTVHVGHRILPDDGITIADWLDTDRRYYAVATHSGITLAPHLAETVARQIRTGERDASLADFGLGRFGNLHRPAAAAGV